MGMAHLQDARILTQRFGGNPDLWSDVKMHLPKLQRKQFYKSLKNGYARGNEALELTENVKSYYFILSQLFQKPVLLSKLEINNTIN
jgi:membrane-bound lytic murein transglycosylase F